MTRTTLGSFLHTNMDKLFAFRGRVVGAQELVNHFSVYHEAHVLTDGESVYFLRMRGADEQPLIRVLARAASADTALAA